MNPPHPLPSVSPLHASSPHESYQSCCSVPSSHPYGQHICDDAELAATTVIVQAVHAKTHTIPPQEALGSGDDEVDPIDPSLFFGYIWWREWRECSLVVHQQAT